MSSSMDGPSSSSWNSRPSGLTTPTPAPACEYGYPSWNSRPSGLTTPAPAPAWQYGYPYPVPEQRISSPVAHRPSGLTTPTPAPACEYGYPSLNSRPSGLTMPAPAPAWQYGYPYPVPEQRISSPVAFNMVSNAHGFSYSRFGNDTYDSIPEIGWDRGDFADKDNRPYMIRWKSGKKVDHRLLMVLESFYQEIYVKRKDMFHKIFPRSHAQLEEVFGKIDVMLSNNNNKMKTRTLQRSLSVGSPRRLERFKVRTPAVIIGYPAGGGGTTGQPETGSVK